MIYLIQFLIGIFTKLTDTVVDDGLKIVKNIEYLFAAIYGSLIAYLLISYPVVRPLLGAVIGLILTLKIDHKSHMLAIAIVIISLFFIDWLKVNYILLILFLIASVADEMLNDYFDRKKKKNLLTKILGYRLLLEITAFSASLILNQWVYFFAILSFDIGYILTTKITNKIIIKHKKTLN